MLMSRVFNQCGIIICMQLLSAAAQVAVKVYVVRKAVAVQRQTAVTAYFSSKQLLLFVFAR